MTKRKNPEFLVTLCFAHRRYMTIDERESLCIFVANCFGGDPTPVGHSKAERIRVRHLPQDYNSYVTVRIAYAPTTNVVRDAILRVEEKWLNWLSLATDKDIELQSIEHVESWSKYR